MSNKEKNVKKPRCIPQNLSMSESAPVCQPWSYAGSHAMVDMLTDQYFLSAYDRLRPGDTIRVVQMKDANIHARDNEVLAFASVTIIKVGKTSIGMTIDSLVIMGGKPSEEQETEFVGDQPSGSGVGQETIEIINQTIENMQETIKALQEEGKSLTNEDLDSLLQSLISGEAFKDMTTNIEQLGQAVHEIQESMNDAPEPDKGVEGGGDQPPLPETGSDKVEEELVPYHKWNPGKGEHQAITGEGDDVKVLFSHKDKAKVLEFLKK